MHSRHSGFGFQSAVRRAEPGSKAAQRFPDNRSGNPVSELPQDVAGRGWYIPSRAARPVTSARGQRVLSPGRGKEWRAWVGGP